MSSVCSTLCNDRLQISTTFYQRLTKTISSPFCCRIFALCLERVTGRNLKETEISGKIPKETEGNDRKLKMSFSAAVFLHREWKKMQSNSANVGKKTQSRHKNGKCRFFLPYLCTGKWTMQKRTKSEHLFLEIALFPPYICNAKPKCRCRNAN